MSKITKIEDYGFECEAGPLSMCADWLDLKASVDLWVVCRERTGHAGEGCSTVRHTSGHGGWRFTAHTNEAEAQASADSMNKTYYAGQPFCVVRHLLDTAAIRGEDGK